MVYVCRCRGQCVPIHSTYIYYVSHDIHHSHTTITWHSPPSHDTLHSHMTITWPVLLTVTALLPWIILISASDESWRRQWWRRENGEWNFSIWRCSGNIEWGIITSLPSLSQNIIYWTMYSLSVRTCNTHTCMQTQPHMHMHIHTHVHTLSRREGGREGGREGRERGREGGREREGEGGREEEEREGVLSCFPSLSSESMGHSELMKEGRGVEGSERGKRVKFWELGGRWVGECVSLYLEVGDVFEDKRVGNGNLSPNALIHCSHIRLVHCTPHIATTTHRQLCSTQIHHSFPASHTHTHSCTHAHTYVHARTHACMQTHTHARTHAHTLSLSCPLTSPDPSLYRASGQ